MATADSSSPATSKTKSLNHSTADAPVLIFQPIPKVNPNSQQPSSSASRKSWAAESIEYDQKVLVELINKHFPDWRRVLNELQRYAVSGKIDTGILATFSDVQVNDLVKRLKEKDYPEVRKWVVNNLDNDTSVLLRRIYDACYDSMVLCFSIPAAVLCFVLLGMIYLELLW